MRSELRNSQLWSIVFDDMPDNLLCHALAPGCSRSTNAPKQSPARNSGSGEPCVDGSVDPVWNGDGPDMTRFANQVNDRPMVFTTLEVIECQFGKLTATKPTAQQGCQDGKGDRKGDRSFF